MKDADGSTVKCHDSRADAIKHQRALYANESAVKETAAQRLANGVDMPMVGRVNEEEIPALWKFVGHPAATASSVTVSGVSNDATNYILIGNVPVWGTNAANGEITIHAGEFAPVVEAEPGTSEAEDEAAVASTEEFEGPLAILGHPTSDRRYLIPGEVSFRELPVPLAVQIVTGEGHDGSEVAGRIDKIEFISKGEFERADEFNLEGVPDEAIVVWGEGVFDGSPASAEAKRLISNGAGVSIDIPTDRMALIDPETFEEVDESTVEMEDVLTGKYLTGLAGKIAGATVVTIPAFEEATVQLTEGHALVAAAYGMTVKHDELASHKAFKELAAQALSEEEIHAGARGLMTLIASAAPLKPPREWFEDPGLQKLTPLTFTEDGRIFGHLADWDGCHTGFSNVCIPPFRSESNFAYFNVGEILCSDGSLMPVGKLMFSREAAKHASTDPRVGVMEAQKHYDDTSKIGGFVRAGTDRFGTWLAGVLRSDLSEEDLQILRANPPSGDWRPIPGKGSELVAAFCVPVPGFPIPRSLVASAADGLTIITGPLQVTLGPHARMRRMAMLRARLREVAA